MLQHQLSKVERNYLFFKVSGPAARWRHNPVDLRRERPNLGTLHWSGDPIGRGDCVAARDALPARSCALNSGSGRFHSDFGRFRSGSARPPPQEPAIQVGHLPPVIRVISDSLSGIRSLMRMPACQANRPGFAVLPRRIPSCGRGARWKKRVRGRRRSAGSRAGRIVGHLHCVPVR